MAHKNNSSKRTPRSMTSCFAYARFACGFAALACIGLPAAPASAQPYTNRPTVVVDMGALDPYGYPAKSDYTQGIESIPVAPPNGAPESLSPTGANVTAQSAGQNLVLPQFANKKSTAPFEPGARQLTRPVLEDILDSAAGYSTAAPQGMAKPSHDDILQAAVANTMKPPAPPSSKPSDITWKESAFDDIIKPAAPSSKPTMDAATTASINAQSHQVKTISPFQQRQPAVMATGAANGMDRVTVGFESNSVVLDPEDKISLDRLVARIGNAPDARLQLRAYASENPADSVSGARRLSLSRALTVRAYLMQQNVSPTRIDVRALGSDVPDGPADRVDLVVIQ